MKERTENSYIIFSSDLICIVTYFRKKYIEKCRHHVVILAYHMSTDRTLINTEGALKKGYFYSPVVAIFLEISPAVAALSSPSKQK